MPGYNDDSHNLEDVRIREEDDLQTMIRPRETATSPSHMDQEKRMRREIANSNERRRMQSINAGFQSLRSLLPHHEGEKLSKAAILQQTAEYIYQLEQEKTTLLSQNCHLKRLINQHEGGGSGTTATLPNIGKKRKLEIHHHTIQQQPQNIQDSLAISTTECTDEGIGPLSPEPGTTSSSGGGGSQYPVPVALISSMSPTPSTVESDLIELRLQLDRERRMRMRLEEEKQIRSIEQMYPERLRDISQQVQLHYQHPENSDVNDLSLTHETAAAVAQLQVVSACNLPPVAQTQTIVATSPLRQASPSPPPPPPEQSISPGASSPIHSLKEHHIPSTRLPSALEAAIKAEPKVEVERLPSPSSAGSGEEANPQGSRLYLASTSRQNLETIVEAIRHLEGDHLFADETAVSQDAPLALTKPRASEPQPTKQQVAHRLLKVEMNPFFQISGSNSDAGHSSSSHNHVQQQQQQRPGVIVVQQHT